MSADRGLYPSETYLERVLAARRAVYPLISAAEDAEIAARTGRARRVTLCPSCGRSVPIATGCWFCRTLYGDRPFSEYETPTRGSTHDRTEQRREREFVLDPPPADNTARRTRKRDA